MMRDRRLLSVLACAFLVLLASGCSDGKVSPRAIDPDVSASEMADVAMESDLITEQVLTGELDGTGLAAPSMSGAGSASGTLTRDVTFSRSRPCPGGGEVQVEGSMHAVYDRDTRTLVAEASGSRTRTDCTHPRGEHTVTVNGTSRWEAFRRRVDGHPDGPQTTHYAGSWSAVRDDGRERSCEIDVTIVRDPENRTRTLDGVICGTTVHRSVTWGGNE